MCEGIVLKGSFSIINIEKWGGQTKNNRAPSDNTYAWNRQYQLTNKLFVKDSYNYLLFTRIYQIIYIYGICMRNLEKWHSRYTFDEKEIYIKANSYTLLHEKVIGDNHIENKLLHCTPWWFNQWYHVWETEKYSHCKLNV